MKWLWQERGGFVKQTDSGQAAAGGAGSRPAPAAEP